MGDASTGRQTYKYPEGDVYEGDWSEEGKKHGVGQLTFVDGTVYEGKFQQGLFDGLGTIVFSDDSYYQGEFKKGFYDGHGIYTRSDGMMFEGRFKNGRPDGPGLITFSDGTNGNPVQEGYFEGTKLVRREKVPAAIKKAKLCAEKAKGITLYNS